MVLKFLNDCSSKSRNSGYQSLITVSLCLVEQEAVILCFSKWQSVLRQVDVLSTMVLFILVLLQLLDLVSSYLHSFGGNPSLRNHYLQLSPVDNKLPNDRTEFDAFNRLLFDRFSLSVQQELRLPKPPSTFSNLIKNINKLTYTESGSRVSNRSKSILVRLFPPGLLPAYKVLFGSFPSFSAWMNTRVTQWTTQWLMGNSTVQDLELADGTMKSQQLLIVERCRFLEESGCIQTCIHACKVPTQNFFYEEMGLPVTLTPNMTDLSCRFSFGVVPVRIQEDVNLRHPCLSQCQLKLKKTNCTEL